MKDAFTITLLLVICNTCIACTAIAGATVLFYCGHGIAGGFTLAFPLVFHFRYDRNMK